MPMSYSSAGRDAGSSSSMTTIRSEIAMQPDDHARSGCVSMRAARLQRCRQSFSTPTWPPAIAIAAHSPTIDATSSR